MIEIKEAIKRLGLPALKVAYKKLQKYLTRKEQKKLLSSAISELLKLDPDIDVAEADIMAAKALGLEHSSTYYKSKRMLEDVKSYKAGRGKVALKKKAAAKKKTASKGKAIGRKKGTAKGKYMGKSAKATTGKKK